MTSTLDAASLVLELLSWIGLSLGIVLLLVGYLLRLAYSGWRETLGVIVPRPGHEPALAVRWLGDDGHLYELAADTKETEHLALGDDVTVFVNPRRPDRARTDPAGHEGHLLRLLGWLFFGIGAASVVVSLVLAIVE